jgi:hypothetical protein
MSCAPPIVTPPPVLWSDWETLARLASTRSKPLDLDACPRINLPPSILWRNRQTEAQFILRPKLKNCHDDFEIQITKLDLLVLRPKSRNRRPWFLGSTKKPALLVSMCIVQTTHGVTQPPDSPATEYPTYA